MATFGSINLFRPNSRLSPVYILLFGYFRTFTIAILGILCVGGVIVFILFTVITSQRNQLTAEKTRLTAVLADSIVKEGMLFDIRLRLDSIATILKQLKSPVPFIDTMQAILAGSELSSLSISDKEEVSLTMKFPSIAATIPIVENVISLTNQKKIIKPMIESFSVSKESGITLAVSYGVVSK